MTREQMIAIVSERMAGSPEAATHTHIECFCEGYVHRRDDYDEGCFCPSCASKAAVALGYPATDTQPECVGPDDGPRWCETCDRLITTEITAVGALEELEHWEAPSKPGGPPETPEAWREFLLCVRAIGEEHLPRVERFLATNDGAPHGARSGR